MGVLCSFALFAVCCVHASRATDAGCALSLQHVSEACTHQYAMCTVQLRMPLEQKLEMTLPRIYTESVLLKSKEKNVFIDSRYWMWTALWGRNV